MNLRRPIANRAPVTESDFDMERFTIASWLAGRLGPSGAGAWAARYLHVEMAAIVLVLICAASIIAWTRLRRTEARLIPEAGPSLTNILEIIAEAVLRMMEDVMGPAAKKHLPVVGAVFIYILACNLIGVVPGFSSPTDNINTNLACAIFVFIYYNYAGIRKRGLRRYLRNMAGPIIWLAPLIFAIELVSHIVRPISLSVRLFGNMVGDHMVLGIFSRLTPIAVPAAFMVLAIFVAFIQAFVFTLLSIIYIALATEGDAP